MHVHDFLNIVWQLRTVPEVLEYLNARRELPTACLRMVGDELPFYELYIMNGGSLKGCLGHADARRAAEAHDDLLREALGRSAEYKLHPSSVFLKRVDNAMFHFECQFLSGVQKNALLQSRRD
jgi:hypothetical protein